MNNGFLFLAVLLFLLWGIGLLDFFRRARKLGRSKKDWAVFLVIGVFHLVAVVFWAALLINPSLLSSVQDRIAFIQADGLWFGLAVFVCLLGIWVINWNLFNAWQRFRFTSTLILVILFFVLLFSNNPFDSPWRQWTVVTFLAILGMEILLQVLTIPGWLPSYPIFQAGMNHQFGRVYQTREGFTNAVLNRYGLHQPDQKINFDPDARRIVLIGGSYLQGFQVSKNQHFAHQLEQLLRSEGSASTQVFALGSPDAGVGVYMYEPLLEIIVRDFEPHEIIFFLHASSDFQCETEQFSDPILFDLDGSTARIRNEHEGIRHALQHFVIRGYHNRFDPIISFKTHLLLPKLIQAWLQINTRQPYTKPAETDDPITAYTAHVIRNPGGKHDFYHDFISVPSIHIDGYRNFLFEIEPGPEAEKTYAVNRSLYQRMFKYLNEQNIRMRMVTIPAFSPGFFSQEGDWSPLVGKYDLFTTERVFREFADTTGFEFLGMGEQIQSEKVPLSTIRSLFFEHGRGHFTPAGHKYFAERTFATFYASDSRRSSQSD